MPDISMCRGTNCPLKKKCYRHTASPKLVWQSWFVNPPIDPKTGECSYFWLNRDETLRRYGK